jgi:hypothetical protein
VKLPFPLTPQFKAMLQSGVGTRDLDVRWVSSLSWYFLTLFGLQPVYNFILGSNNGKSLRLSVHADRADVHHQPRATSHSRWPCRILEQA